MTDIFVAPTKKKQIHNTAEEAHMNILSTFCQNPIGIHFQTQKKNESIILFLRSHFITNLSWIIISIMLITIPLG